MHLEALVLCDAATDNQGKLNILGSFDTIFARKIPAVHADCCLAARLRFSNVEQGKHQLAFTIIDTDGRKIAPDMNGELNVNIAENRTSVPVNLIIRIQQLKFEQFGEYRIDMAVDGRHLASLPVFIQPVPETNRKQAQ